MNSPERSPTQRAGDEATATVTPRYVRPHRLSVSTCLVVVLATLITLIGPLSSPAGADARSSSRVIGRGDILTTITNPTRTTGRSTRTRRATPAPTCRDVTFSDNEIEMLVAALSWDPEAPTTKQYAELVDRYIAQVQDQDDATSGFDLVARYCGDELEGIRAVARVVIPTLAQRVSRSMLTRLPAPVVHQNPPEDSAVPVGEPVFIAADPQTWTRIDDTLDFAGLTAHVRATPTAIRVFSGEPGARFTTCQGSGKRFNITSPLSARRQASAGGACAIFYRGPFDQLTAGTARLGSVSVLWRTEWRLDNGPWRSLGLIPRTRLFARSVVELGTPITRTFYPTRAGNP